MTAERDDGGQAFPSFTNQYHYGYQKDLPATVEPGMTLRDYFAVKALWITGAPSPVTGQRPAPEEYAYVAEHAYALADAMLKARQA